MGGGGIIGAFKNKSERNDFVGVEKINFVKKYNSNVLNWSGPGCGIVYIVCQKKWKKMCQKKN